MGLLLNPLVIATLAGMMCVTWTLTAGYVGREGRNGIPGPQGPAGISGPQGVVGEKCDCGDPGLPGPQGGQGAQGQPAGGAVYTRWGRTSCPSGQGTELLYSGRAGGTDLHKKGGAANFLCLPDHPQYTWTTYGTPHHGASPITGVEYAASRGQPLGRVVFHNMPCAVCYTSSRGTVVMIPARGTCPTNWTREYNGVIMTNYDGNDGRYLYECIDDRPESVPGLNGMDYSVARIYHVEATCKSFSCPPYDATRQLSCVVCTR